jgi:hypothetical protein
MLLLKVTSAVVYLLAGKRHVTVPLIDGSYDETWPGDTATNYCFTDRMTFGDIHVKTPSVTCPV